MDGVGTARADGFEDGLGVEVALRCRLATQGVGLVGQANMEGVAVEVRVDGDGGHPELAAGPDDPDRDLATVGDEDLLQHAAPFGSGSPVCPVTARRTAINLVTARRVSAMPGARFSDVRRFAAHRLDEPLPARRGAGRSPSKGWWRSPTYQTAGRGRRGRAGPRPRAPTCWCRCSLRPRAPASAGGPWPWLRWRWRPGTRCEAVSRDHPRDQVAERPGRLRTDARWPGCWPRPTPTTAAVRRRRPFDSDAPAVVVGIGINCNWPGVTPISRTEIADSSDAGPDPPARLSLRQLSGQAGRPGRSFSPCSSYTSAHGSTSWRTLRDETRSASRTPRRDHHARHPRTGRAADRTIEGTATDLTDEGHLIVPDRKRARRPW